MSLPVSCPCGFSAAAPDSRAGARTSCPRCGSPIRIPGPAAPPALEMEDAPPASGTAATPPCARCGTQYPADVVVCVACGLSLLTGQPVGAAEPEPVRRRAGLVQAEEDDLEATPFWKIALGIVLSPVSTMERFPAWLGRPDFLGKSAALYAASFLVVILVGIVLSRPENNAATLAVTHEIERAGTVAHMVPGEWTGLNLMGGQAAEVAARLSQVERKFGGMGHPGVERLSEMREGMEEQAYGGRSVPPLVWRIVEPNGGVEAGKPFPVRVRVQSIARDLKLRVTAIRIAWASDYGGQPQEGFRPMTPGAEDEWTAELTATRTGGTSAVFEFDVEGDVPGRGPEEAFREGAYGEGAAVPMVSRPRAWATWAHLPGWGRLALADRPELRDQLGGGSRMGTLVGAAFGAAGATAAVLVNLAGILITAGLFTVAARCLGGGGGFLPMLVALGLLTAVTNTFQLALCFVPVGTQPLFSFGLAGYGFVLQLIALQKVFDIDLLGALLTVVLAVAAKLFGAAYVVFAILTLFGVGR